MQTAPALLFLLSHLIYHAHVHQCQTATHLPTSSSIRLCQQPHIVTASFHLLTGSKPCGSEEPNFLLLFVYLCCVCAREFSHLMVLVKHERLWLCVFFFYCWDELESEWTNRNARWTEPVFSKEPDFPCPESFDTEEKRCCNFTVRTWPSVPCDHVRPPPAVTTWTSVQ